MGSPLVILTSESKRIPIQVRCLRFNQFCSVENIEIITYYETDELPNPKTYPTQEKLDRLKSGVLGHFFCHSKEFFVGWD